MQKTLELGKKLYFTNEKLPYNIMAITKRYAIVSRPLNRREDADLLHHQVRMGAYCSFTEAFEKYKKNPVYSILDFKEEIKSTDNLIFSNYDYSTEKGSKKAIQDLETGKMQLSKRNLTTFSIDWDKTDIVNNKRKSK